MPYERFSGDTPEASISAKNEQQSIRERIAFPHIEPILKLLKEEFKEEGMIDEEAVKDILYEFVEQRIETADVYVSEKNGAAFPWGVTDTGAMAKRLYERYAGEKMGSLIPSEERKKIEFVFTSLQAIKTGNQFAFMEEPLHQAVKDLPAAITKIKEGKEPDPNQIFTLGSPTNTLGEMSPEFLERLKNGDTFSEFGKLYAEFIEKIVPEDERGKTNMLLYGESMGASFAASTGDMLLKDGTVTQESRAAAQQENKPYLDVRLDVPVGSSDMPTSRKKWQIPLGFAGESVIAAATDPYLRTVTLKDGAFLDSAQKMFDEKGLHPKLSKEQIALKKEGISAAINALRSGTPIPEGLKVTKVVGANDLLMYSDETKTEIEESKRAHKGSLAEGLISHKPNERTFGVDMHHNIPFFRRNELKRIQHAQKILSELKKQ